VLTADLVAGLVSPTPFRFTREADLDFVMFLVVTTCSAPFWTLLGRSTLGGFVLNIAAFIPLISLKASLWAWNPTAELASRTTDVLVLSAAVLGYSAAMLWLGRWMLVRRQSGDGLSGPDITEFIPALMPARIASLFRCRSNQVIRNLIRNELRMLRPLWLFMALYIAGWTAMVISFSLVPSSGGRQQTLLVILVGLTATYPVI